MFQLDYALVRTLFEMRNQSGSVNFTEMWGNWERSRQLHRLDREWKNPREKSKDSSRLTLEKNRNIFFFFASVLRRFLREGQHSIVCLCLQKADYKERSLHEAVETSVEHMAELFQTRAIILVLGWALLGHWLWKYLRSCLFSCSEWFKYPPAWCPLVAGLHSSFVTSVSCQPSGEGWMRSERSTPLVPWASLLLSVPSHSFQCVFTASQVGMSWHHLILLFQPCYAQSGLRKKLGRASGNYSNEALLVTWRVGVTQETSRAI